MVHQRSIVRPSDKQSKYHYLPAKRFDTINSFPLQNNLEKQEYTLHEFEKV